MLMKIKRQNLNHGIPKIEVTYHSIGDFECRGRKNTRLWLDNIQAVCCGFKSRLPLERRKENFLRFFVLPLTCIPIKL